MNKKKMNIKSRAISSLAKLTFYLLCTGMKEKKHKALLHEIIQALSYDEIFILQLALPLCIITKVWTKIVHFTNFSKHLPEWIFRNTGLYSATLTPHILSFAS